MLFLSDIQHGAFNSYILQEGKTVRKYISTIKNISIILLVFMLCGCLSRLPFAKGKEKEKALPSGTSQAMADYREPLAGPVSMEEAMARALLYGYNRRLGQMQTALSETPYNISDSEAMDRMSISAGYGQDTRSGSLFSEQKIRSLVYPGGDRADSLASAWNILDFGLSFAMDRQGNNPVSLSESTRQKVIQNIISQVRQVYYQTVIAETLRAETETLLEKARSLLRYYREKPAQAETSREELEKQRQLVETVRFLWDLSQKMAETKAELAVLMGLNPGTPLQIMGINWQNAGSLPSDKSMTDMELFALVHRSELRSSGDKAGTGVYETRKALGNLRPEINFDAGYDRSNPFHQAGIWQDAGLKTARQLFALVPQSGTAQTSQNAAYARSMPLSMAVVSQLHLSLHRYLLAVEEYRISRDLAEVNRKMNPSGTDAQSLSADDQTDRFSQVREETEVLTARIRYYLAFAEIQNAAGRFYNSLGTGQFSSDILRMDVKSLTASIQQVLRQQPEQLRQSRPQQFADKQSAPSAPQQSPLPDDSGKEKKTPGSPVAENMKTVPSEEKAVVTVDASKAGNDGRQPVREISVFRDVVTIHSAPSHDAPVKGQGLIGEKYRLLGWAPNGWLKIEMGDGSAGWIPTKYVRPVETAPADTVPQKPEQKTVKPPAQTKVPPAAPRPVSEGQKVLEPKAPPKVPSALRPEPEGQKLAETTARANVRVAPSLESAILYTEEKGRKLPIISKAGEWFKVNTGKGEGWLHRSVIKLFSE